MSFPVQCNMTFQRGKQHLLQRSLCFTEDKCSPCRVSVKFYIKNLSPTCSSRVTLRLSASPSDVETSYVLYRLTSIGSKLVIWTVPCYPPAILGVSHTMWIFSQIPPQLCTLRCGSPVQGPSGSTIGRSRRKWAALNGRTHDIYAMYKDLQQNILRASPLLTPRIRNYVCIYLTYCFPAVHCTTES